MTWNSTGWGQYQAKEHYDTSSFLEILQHVEKAY
jgi:hypothetical protein